MELFDGMDATPLTKRGVHFKSQMYNEIQKFSKVKVSMMSDYKKKQLSRPVTLNVMSKFA